MGVRDPREAAHECKSLSRGSAVIVVLILGGKQHQPLSLRRCLPAFSGVFLPLFAAPDSSGEVT